MDKSSAEAFEYSKASGLLGKSFINSRVSLLFEQNSLADLWNLLFKTPVPLMPERLLAEEIENEAFKQLINQFGYFIDNWDNPPEVLKDQFKIFEIENLKEIGDALCSGEKECPRLIPLGKFTSLHLEKWPDLKKITEDTEYEWYNKVPVIDEQQQRDFELDLYLIKSYWNGLKEFSGVEKEAQLKLFNDEYILKNELWALRLLIYYEMDKDEIIKHLFYVTDGPSKKDPVAGPAIKMLERNPEKFSDWENWEYAKYLNPNENGVWKIDPAYIERKSMQRKQINANHIFHQNPMTCAAMVAWFKIKRIELSCIRTAVERIRLNINSQDAMNMIGISSGGE